MDQKQLNFIDILSIMGFCINIANLNENLTQSDKQDLTEELNTKINLVLQEIHTHLQKQDIKIDKILEELKYDNRRDF
jgi:hypothetical protein